MLHGLVRVLKRTNHLPGCYLSRARVASKWALLSSGSTLNPNPHRRQFRAVNRQTNSNMGENIMPEEVPFPLTEVDKWVLSQTDEEYTYHTWDELCEVIGMDRLNFVQ